MGATTSAKKRILKIKRHEQRWGYGDTLGQSGDSKYNWVIALRDENHLRQESDFL